MKVSLIVPGCTAKSKQNRRTKTCTTKRIAVLGMYIPNGSLRFIGPSIRTHPLPVLPLPLKLSASAMWSPPERWAAGSTGTVRTHTRRVRCTQAPWCCPAHSGPLRRVRLDPSLNTRNERQTAAGGSCTRRTAGYPRRYTRVPAGCSAAGTGRGQSDKAHGLHKTFSFTSVIMGLVSE